MESNAESLLWTGAFSDGSKKRFENAVYNLPLNVPQCWFKLSSHCLKTLKDFEKALYHLSLFSKGKDYSERNTMEPRGVFECFVSPQAIASTIKNLLTVKKKWVWDSRWRFLWDMFPTTYGWYANTSKTLAKWRDVAFEGRSQRDFSIRLIR